jgi:hypothetical protein
MRDRDQSSAQEPYRRSATTTPFGVPLTSRSLRSLAFWVV